MDNKKFFVSFALIIGISACMFVAGYCYALDSAYAKAGLWANGIVQAFCVSDGYVVNGELLNRDVSAFLLNSSLRDVKVEIERFDKK